MSEIIRQIIAALRQLYIVLCMQMSIAASAAPCLFARIPMRRVRFINHPPSAWAAP